MLDYPDYKYKPKRKPKLCKEVARGFSDPLQQVLINSGLRCNGKEFLYN